MNKSRLQELVLSLLEQGKEGEYWDFKQEWHEKIEDLLKDIICFANTVHSKDCYIIFGVADDLTVTGMKKDRRKQADIIDALSKLKFAGDIYPKIELTTIDIDYKDVDILRIFDVEKTPIYLKENYGQMRPGCIYTRVGDKNTPDKGNADMTDIENLWRKRFGLTKSKLEYIYDHLANKTEWNEFEELFYNIYYPELTIEVKRDVDDDRLVPEFYAFAMTNHHTSYETLNIKCQQTILESYQIVVLDGGRLSVPTPTWGKVIYEDNRFHKKYDYKYYEKDNLTFKVFKFLYDPENGDHRFALWHYQDVILFYESKKEREDFEAYINENKEEFEKRYKELNRTFLVELTDKTLNKDVYIKRLRTGCVLSNMYEEWKEMMSGVTSNPDGTIPKEQLQRILQQKIDKQDKM